MHIRDYFDKAQSQGFAIGAFNAANLETIKAIVEAAHEMRSPVIIESSPGETEYIQADNLVCLVNNFRQKYGLPIFINLDHSPTVSACQAAIQAGYDLIHVDTGKIDDWQEKINTTKQVVQSAHSKGLLVEGEIDHITGSSTLHQEAVEQEQQQGNYTDVEQAAEFIWATEVDTFAAFVGNCHGMYATPPTLDVDRLKQIRQKTDVFLSLHGGSGIPADQIQAAIKQGGVVKINVNTEMRLAYRQKLEQVLQSNQELAVYKYMPDVIQAVKQVVIEKIKLFGSQGKADG